MDDVGREGFLCDSDVHEFASVEDGRHVALRDIVIDTSTNLMSAAPDEFETKVRWGLETIGEQIGADRGYVFHDHEGDFELTEQWTVEDVDPWETEHLTLEEYACLAECLGKFDNGLVRDADALAAGAMKELLAAESVTSAVFVPLVDEWELLGFLGFDTVDREQWWTETEVALLRTIGDMLGHSLARVRRERTLERQNDRLDAFAGIVSHDLRNPLNVVTSRLELAERTGDPEHVSEAADAADRMDRLIDRVLALAREGRDIGATERVALDRIVADAWDSVDTGDATLVRDGDLGVVDADADRLRAAFENLFRNAVEHGSTSPASQARQDAVEQSASNAGPKAVRTAGDGRQAQSHRLETAGATEAVDVTVRVGPLADGAGFYVADDGPGIPAEEFEAVFEREYSSSEGDGFGLWIVRIIVEAHGWSIRACGADDGGARFEVSF